MTAGRGMQLRCIVFDLDDTLYLERDYVRSGFCHVGMLVEEQFGVSGFSEAAWQFFLEGQRGDIFDRALRIMGISADHQVIERLVESYRNHYPRIALAEDATICLNTLRSTHKLALITDGSASSQENKIQALGIPSWISIRILTGVWGGAYSKPHPRGFLAAQEQLNAIPTECVYVADNPQKDFDSPAALGWATVRIRRNHGLHSHLISERPKPDYEFKDMSGLLHLLNTSDPKEPA